MEWLSESVMKFRIFSHHVLIIADLWGVTEYKADNLRGAMMGKLYINLAE